MSSINDMGTLSKEAKAALEGELLPGEPVRVVVPGTFGTGLVATDRRVLIWKGHRLHEFPWKNLANVAFGGGTLVKWVQVRGPSIGLVGPSLLNIGKLIDTIQVGPMPDDATQVALETLVARHAQGQPLEGPNQPVSGLAAAGQMEGVIMEARGAGGGILVFPDHVRIRHRGFRGFLRQSLPAEKDISLERIDSIEWQDPGAVRLGRIRFHLRPGSTDGADEAGPEYEVMFYLHQEVSFREVRAEITRRMTPL